MRTEELANAQRTAETHGASLALQDLMPPAWEIVDARGKAVRLSSAGLVLHFGRRYELRVLAHAETEPPPDLRLLSAPHFLKRHEGPGTAAKHGRGYRCLPFSVRSEYGWFRRLFKAPYEVAWGDLEVECTTPPDAGLRLVVLSCPVVARMPWSIGLALLLIVGYLGGWFLGQLGNIVRDCWIRGAWPWQNSEDWWSLLPTNPYFWLWPVIVAALNPVACLMTHLYYLWQRSYQLEASYRERYPAAMEGHGQ